MIGKLLISICMIGLTTAALTVDAAKHCECTELTQTDCGAALSYCLWNSSDSECQEFNLECSDLNTQITCDAFSSCKWKDGACDDWTPSCSDGTTVALCRNINGCYWNKSNQCASFSTCADYSVEECPENQFCTAQSGSCAAYQFVTCSSFTTSQTCTGFDTQTSQCAWANDNTCKSVKSGSSCADLSNFTNLCNNSGSCTYEGSACRSIKCSDLPIEQACNFVFTSDTSFTLCAWANGACADAADTSAYTQTTCYQRTFGNYKWTSDNKCLACDDLVSNDMDSNQLILGAFALLLVLLE
ncbi:unnamed protein product (macronuclear) [Paramecium tetraurelia]|uniref:Mini antigen n=1 Tax=Paramecium tetraurelia TaxID=5888 RepID=A0DB26_PARTE|nr:uncharacterized protein GSPATT00015137001 [Paramecium tetraurelia]CAK80243.1 unnamed protein product [Paramecium tetraurelia]|eukprot:XP_001447640.1 hypothetical protein (macronuclear) [Paramecium tetraurelia strain d4-2]